VSVNNVGTVSHGSILHLALGCGLDKLHNQCITDVFRKQWAQSEPRHWAHSQNNNFVFWTAHQVQNHKCKNIWSPTVLKLS